MKTITLYIQPGAKRTQVMGLHQDLPKIALHAPAVEGAANTALIAYLAKLSHSPRTSIKIVAGLHSRIKKVSLSDKAYGQLKALLYLTDTATPP